MAQENNFSTLPRQDVPETSKNLEWCKRVFQYAEQRFYQKSQRYNQKITRLYKVYLGETDPQKIKYLTHTYGKANIGNFVSYRLAKPKIDIINGEFLNSPLNSTVYTINREAKSKKLESIYTLLGAIEAKEQIDKLRENGYNVLDGFPVPDKNDPNLKEKINIKSQNEKAMQESLNHFIKSTDIITKLARNLFDVEIASECHLRIFLNVNGFPDVEIIDPRYAVYEELQHDPFLLKSPYRGQIKPMFVGDIINGFELTDKQRDDLYKVAKNPHQYTNQSYAGRNYYSMFDNELVIETMHLQWYSLRPLYTKILPDETTKELSPEYYERNKPEIDKEINKGKFKIVTRWIKDVWEATRIGNDMFVGFQRKPWQQRYWDTPSETKTDYLSLVFNTVDGTRVSLMEQIENIDFMYDVVMYMINREIVKAKGKVVVYDMAFLPKGETTKSVLHGMANESLMLINSAQEGNRIGRDLQFNSGLREIDLGISQTVQQLINIKVDLQNMADRFSGINEYREGQTPASSTLGGASQAIRSSRNITAPMFWHFNRFIEQSLSLMVEYAKLSFAYFHPQLGEMIIGTEALNLFRVTPDVVNDDYGVYLSDPQKEQELREFVNQLATVSVNNQQLRPQDFLEMNMEDTTAGMIAILKKGWSEIQNINQQIKQREQEADAQNLKLKLDIGKEDREDRQEHEKELAYIKAGKEQDMETLKAKNKFLLTKEEEEQEPEMQEPENQLQFEQ